MKILVTTDFSINSKAAIYFAVQLAKQMPVSITFFHSYHILRPHALNEQTFEPYRIEQTEKIADQLKDFIHEVTQDLDVSAHQFNYVIRESVVADANILYYAEQNEFDYICMGTRGAGRVEKYFGTNTSNVVNKSQLPVIAVPMAYKSKSITNFLYASDLSSLDKEINKIMHLAKPLEAKVEILNFSFPFELNKNRAKLENFVKLSEYPVTFNIQKNDFQNTLVENIVATTEKSPPSLLVMFTNQKRSFIEKLLFSSNSGDVAFDTKVPLLIFQK